MNIFARNARHLCLGLAISILFFGTGVAFLVMGRTAKTTTLQERYYRALYVLQSFGGPAAAEVADIPRHISWSDEVENLLHHSDKILVLRHVADEFAAVRVGMPRAPLFEAYARLALGERQQAAKLLSAYVAENEYTPPPYSLLTDLLYTLEDFSSLSLICREWREHDPSCQSKRARLGWVALFNSGRFERALAYLKSETSCLGWRADVYAAKSNLALGREQEAALVLESALQRYAGKADQIHRLWEQIRDKMQI